jgi:hydrogenase nickel incorporation protein HypB
MCTTCGCGDTELVPVELHEKILAGNDRAARHNREHFVAAGVLALNLMGSPGAGKTAVLEATAKAAAAKGWKLGAVSADLATDNDARRLEKAGIPSKAITTGQACHLDAELVHRSLHGVPWDQTDVFFIENVGNLVCPAIYDLGQAANVVVLSVTEGEDKPLKYPVMFKAADLVLVTKCDLVPHLDVDLAKLHDALARVMPRPRVLEVSARTGKGLDAWIAWLEELRRPMMSPALPLKEVRMRAHGHGPGEAHEHEHAHEHAHEHEHEHGGKTHSHPHVHRHGHPHDHGKGGGHEHGGSDHAHDHSDHDHPHKQGG